MIVTRRVDVHQVYVVEPEAIAARLDALVHHTAPEFVDPHLCCYDQFFAVDPRPLDALADGSLVAVYLCSVE